MCRSTLNEAASKKMDCPIRLHPRCHPKANFDVYVDAPKSQFVLCCSSCDQPVEFITAKLGRRKKNAPMDRGTAT